jgi:hypothetical protein
MNTDDDPTDADGAPVSPVRECDLCGALTTPGEDGRCPNCGNPMA